MIKVICVGKIKEEYLKEGIIDYYQRISKYHKIELIEVADSNKKEEGERILKKIAKKDYVITLEITGKEYDSISFAQHLEKLQMEHANITFIIGSSHGLDPAITMLSQEKISFSKMTFPHQLFRILLLEQLYRSFKIMHNETYHK